MLLNCIWSQCLTFFPFCALIRMENSVLGNALEGVPEESEEEDQPNSSNIESANNLDGQYVLSKEGLPGLGKVKSSLN